MVVKEGYKETVACFFLGYQFQIVTGTQYLGGYVGLREQEMDWIKEKLAAWDTNISWMAEVAHFKPQLAYIGLQRSLQAKWIFVQRVTADMHEQFLPLVVTM